MPTRLLLAALLSAAAAPVLGQVPSSAALMRIDPAVQRQRDVSRIVILQDELAAEALALAEAQKQSRFEDVRSDPRRSQEASQRIARHRQNISALAKELALVDRQAPATRVQPAVTTSATAEPLPRAVAAVRERAEDRRPASGARIPDWLIPANAAGREP